MTLLEKQQRFPQLVARLVLWLVEQGYDVTFGEAHRPKVLAELYAEEGKGISNSLHCVRLAIDLNLFRGGSYLKANDEYRPAGLFWRSLSTPEYICHWGGDWGDGNHFSLGHDGIK